jgi:hypothetical protein
MDYLDLDDPTTYLDPHYGEILRAAAGSPDLWDPDDLFDLDPLYDDVVVRADSWGVTLDLAPVRPSTLRRLEGVETLSRLHVHTDRVEARTVAESRSFRLNDTFMCDGHGSLPSRPPDDTDWVNSGRSFAFTGAEVTVWLDQSTTFLRSLRDLTLWVRGAALSVLPGDILQDIVYAAWDLFYATLIFPRTRAAFEAFAAAPSASPEVARYRLAGVGPMGPPLPPSHARPFFGRWGVEYYDLVRDDILDLEAVAVTALHILGPITEWVEGAPVSELSPEVLGEVSRTAWELMVASLRIPWAREEFEHLCSDPPALRASAGLPPLLSVAAVAIEEVSQRSRVRRRAHRRKI